MEQHLVNKTVSLGTIHIRMSGKIEEGNLRYEKEHKVVGHPRS